MATTQTGALDHSGRARSSTLAGPDARHQAAAVWPWNCQSHALDQDRTAGLGLDVAIMTNLGRDHLDYHPDLNDYLQAKARILDLLRPVARAPEQARATGLNADVRQLAQLDTANHPVVRFSAQPGASGRLPI